jgi:hypothetical protein
MFRLSGISLAGAVLRIRLKTNTHRFHPPHGQVHRKELKSMSINFESDSKFFAIHSVYNLFNTQRHLISRKTNRLFRDELTFKGGQVVNATLDNTRWKLLER